MRSSRPLFSRRSSLPAKLALLAALFVLAVVTVRVLSLDRLAHVDAVSGEVHNRWLDSVRLLGTVNHHIATVRAQEAEALLHRDASGISTSSDDLLRTLNEITQDVERYRSIPHDRDESLAFDSFLKDWTDHGQHAQAIVALAQGGQGDAATALFEGEAHSSFQAAADGLRSLIDLTETKADAARKAAAEAIARAQRFVSDLILAMLVLFVTLTAYLWHSFSRPLLDLAGLMRRLASHDTRFSVPFESRRDEIGDVARSLAVFRRNTIELLESRKSLATQADILAGALEKERALAVEQRNFITTMSHEFRTPLTSIDGHAQRLLATKDQVPPSQIADRAHKIRAAVFRMTSLVVSFTGAMEIASGQAQPRTRRFDLSRMLRDLQGYYREIGMGDILEEEIGDLPQEITGDPELLYYAFSNVISNAFKYSPEGGIVTLVTKVTDACVEITVEDRGVGIPPDEIDRVRERFYRGSNVGTLPGTGVGLYLVDLIVRQHRGSLRIDSEVGRGTRMTVSLPIDGPGPSPREDASEQDLVYRGRRRDGEPSGGGAERARLHS
ncbi:sensor histidine kinase [Microvirga ossetica]|nr:ATP-binding protein [Microvirga ossetica]